MHDKLSDYVGNHGGSYVDGDGNTRQFTYVDHDIQPNLYPVITKNEVEEAKKMVKEIREEYISYILSSPASLCPPMFTDYTVRGDISTIQWNEKMLRDEGVPLDKIRDIKILLEKRIENNI